MTEKHNPVDSYVCEQTGLRGSDLTYIVMLKSDFEKKILDSFSGMIPEDFYERYGTRFGENDADVVETVIDHLKGHDPCRKISLGWWKGIISIDKLGDDYDFGEEK